MKIRTVANGLIVVGSMIAAVACEDTRPPYFNEQPTYSDPDLQDKPSYFHREPVYDWNTPAKPAVGDPNAK